MIYICDVPVNPGRRYLWTEGPSAEGPTLARKVRRAILPVAR